MNQVSGPFEHGQDQLPLEEVVAATTRTSRLPVTWFGSGRAAFVFLVRQVVCPDRVHLPAICCPSLVGVLRSLVPSVAIHFYPLDSELAPRWPDSLGARDAVLLIHYLGYEQSQPPRHSEASVIEDYSHRLLDPADCSTSGFRFGSLRKLYPVADGGWVAGAHDPAYEPADWNLLRKRSSAGTWADCNEAEGLLDRRPRISDMSSDSLAVVLTSDIEWIAARRRSNELELRRRIRVGDPLRPFRPEDTPLGHARVFDSQKSRDMVRAELARNGIFASILWEPGSDTSLEGEPRSRAEDWSARHLVLPVGPHLDHEAMKRVAEICNGAAGR